MIGYLDCFSGVSGDKLLGALLDAGLELDALRDGLAGLPIGGWNLEAEPVERAGFRGTKATVAADGDQPHRTWRDVRAIVEDGDLPDPVAERAAYAIDLLATAEARAHGTTLEEVHFHEVGAIDSIVDVVGSVLGVHLLGIERLVCSPVALGAGTVETAHGTLPVPAPATLHLLEDVPVYGGPVAGELTTPTGAALVRALADRYGPMPPMTPRTTGLGAGSRDLELPNLLRLAIGDPISGTTAETVVSIRTVIDHRTPEQLAHALDQVREAGALDAWQTPVVMKKGRSGVEVTVLAAPAQAERLAETLMSETGTLGVRREFVERLVVERSVVTLETGWGPVRFKIGRSGGGRDVRPEHEDVARIASERGLAAHEVAEQLTREAANLLDD